MTIMHVRQGQAKGLGHAVLCAQPLVGDAPFAVVLPDVLIDDASADLEKEDMAAMIREFESTGASQILVEAVDKNQVDKYGVVDLDGADVKPGESAPIKAMVEKPPVNKAPSNLAVVGRYVLPASIWEILKHTPPGAGNEIQLTDAIVTLMKSSQVKGLAINLESQITPVICWNFRCVNR